jgi:hypothetical protein
MTDCFHDFPVLQQPSAAVGRTLQYTTFTGQADLDTQSLSIDKIKLSATEV